MIPTRDICHFGSEPLPPTAGLGLADWLDILDECRGATKRWETLCLRCGGSLYDDADTWGCEHVRLRDVVPQPRRFVEVMHTSGEIGWAAVDSCSEPCSTMHPTCSEMQPTRNGAIVDWRRQWVIGQFVAALFGTLSRWTDEGSERICERQRTCPHDTREPIACYAAEVCLDCGMRLSYRMRRERGLTRGRVDLGGDED